MTSVQIAVYVFLVLQGALVLFQLALAAGAPWGSLAMGGRFPGRFPPAMRVAAVVQVVLYVLMAAIIVSRAGVALPEWREVSRVAVWVVVALMAAAVAMNVITPSKWERRIWAPVALALFACGLVVALS